MGRRILSFFVEAERIAGVVGKMRLAELTGVFSGDAATIEDTPEVVRRFERAIATLRPSLESSGSGEDAQLAVGASTTAVLRKHIGVYLDLMSQRSLALGNVAATIRRVNEAAAETLEIARVSVWDLDDKRTKITCADLYERSTKRHSAGIELGAAAFPAYFAALETERTIAAHDAHRDSRTSCFSATYLTPLGINSMLDVPIRVDGKMRGVICHEHIGPRRTWDSDEERFGYLMASLIALAVERAG